MRNRLHIISVNGAIGFGLILITLLVFLNWRSGFWVAMGIPFTLCFTILAASLMGQTINGITLAAVIILMGIVVDDAIVVAENITRLMHQGMERFQATVQGTTFVMLPVIASIVTTCAAFIPLYFFQGRQGRMIVFIPPIIFLMLAASLIESLFILPGHMNLNVGAPRRAHPDEQTKAANVKHWFDRIEARHGKNLQLGLRHKTLLILGFIAFLGVAGYVVHQRMNYVMFPNEETRDVVLMGETTPGSTRYETAEKVGEIESLFVPYLGKEVVGFRTEVAQSRWGGGRRERIPHDH